MLRTSIKKEGINAFPTNLSLINAYCAEGDAVVNGNIVHYFIIST